MKIKHTNRHGNTYYLHKTMTKKGSIRYVMKKEAKGALTKIPEGYEISEDVNGTVSMRQIKARIISKKEENFVLSFLKKLSLMGYRVSSKGKYLIIYEPAMDKENAMNIMENMEEMLSGYLTNLASMLPENHPLKNFTRPIPDTRESRSRKKKIRKMVESSRVSPILRFELLDKEKRIFGIERMCFRGEGGWRDLYTSHPLNEACEKYLPHLEKESFFDL
jgi:hypothetical protein